MAVSLICRSCNKKKESPEDIFGNYAALIYVSKKSLCVIQMLGRSSRDPLVETIVSSKRTQFDGFIPSFKIFV